MSKTDNIKVLELFAGSRSIGKVAQDFGMTVLSSDVQPFDGIDYSIDIMAFDCEQVPFVPNVIWSSPPCTGFSVAAIGHHWKKEGTTRFPKTKTTRIGLRYVLNTIAIIKYYMVLNPDLLWYIENPRGMLRKMFFMEELPIRHTVTYCQYGENRMKPTDIWTNDTNWKPKSRCKNGSSCHEASPRGSKTGTQALKNNYERSKLPQQLCQEILTSSMVTIGSQKIIDKA